MSRLEENSSPNQSQKKEKVDLLRKQNQSLLPRCDMCKEQFRNEGDLETVTLQITENDCFHQNVCSHCKGLIGNFSLGNQMDARQLSLFRSFNNSIGGALADFKQIWQRYLAVKQKPIQHKVPEKQGTFKLFVPVDDADLFEVQTKSIRSVFMLQRLIWANDLIQCDSDIQEEMKGGLSGNFNEDKFVNRPSNRQSMSSCEEMINSDDQKRIMEISPVLRDLNNPVRDCAGVQSLPDQNKAMYAKMRQIYDMGFFPPLILRQHEKQGFFVEALADIPLNTLICEQGGEVVTQRDINLITDSDSVMELIRATSSKNSLLIWPWRFANLAKFFNGVNNYDTDGRKKQNLSTIRCVIDNRVKVLLQTIKPIKKGQTLAFDYNAGGMDEQPTENFN